MNLVKLSLVTAAAAFAFSCSQTTPTTTTTTSSTANAKNSMANVAAVTPQAQNRTEGNIDQQKRLQRAMAVAPDDEVESKTDDIYATNCMICHKDTGKGGKVSIKGKSLSAADLTSEKMKKLADEKLFEYISEGVPDEGMPEFKGKLSEDQIRSVVAQVRGLQSK